MAEYDILVIGAGPAGSTFAHLAARQVGLRVLLLDARPLHRPFRPGDRIKSCGGLLAPDAQRALARWHGALPAEALASPQLFAVRAIDLNRGREALYPRSYINIRRESFDRWLFALADGADRQTGIAVRGIRPDRRNGKNLWRVSTADGRDIFARFVVGADGANSVTRRQLFPGLNRALMARRYVSVQEVFAGEIASPHFAALFAPDITDYYAWGLPKDGEYLIGAALPAEAGAERRFRMLKERMRAFGFRAGTPLRREATLLLRPTNRAVLWPLIEAGRLVRAGRDDPNAGTPPAPPSSDGPHACLLGEAGGFISPSSAEGISYALHTAMLLAGTIRQHARRADPHAPAFFHEVCRAYARALWPLRLKLVGKNGKSGFLFHPELRALIMASGLTSINASQSRES